MTGRRRTVWAVLVGGLLLSSPLLATLTVGQPAPGVQAVAYAGDETVRTADGDRRVWQTGEHAVEVEVTPPEAGSYEVCLDTGNDPFACETVTLSGGTTTVTLAFDTFPTASDAETLTAVVRASETGDTVGQATTELSVLARDGDLDADGLTNVNETELDTNLTAADTDGDGLTDGTEVSDSGTDPTVADTDGDGLTDGREVTALGTDPNRADSDGDGLADGAEVSTYDTDPTAADTDGDGLADDAEVRTHQTDPTTVDTDGDGVADGAEVNVHGTDPTTVDTDGDGLADGAEVSTHDTDPTAADTDGDGLADGPEINTYATNPNAADTDGDGATDGREIAAGTDPTAVSDTPSPVASVRPALVGGAVVAVLALLGVVAVRRRGVPRPLDRFVDDVVTVVATAPADPAASDDTNDTTTTEMLSDRERVLRLLEANDGRLHQQRIVEATDWSKAKVSTLLSEMEDDGEITKLRIGRENLITLPEARVEIGAGN